MELAKLLDGLPELQRSTAGSDAIGDPVTLEQLREVLEFWDADVPYPEWRDVIAAIRATNAGEEDDRLEIAHQWSATVPSRYSIDPDAVDRVFWSMPPKEGGIGFGTLFAGAKGRGYDKPPFPTVSLATTFADYKPEPSAPAEEDEGWVSFDTFFLSQPPPVVELIEGLVEQNVVSLLSGPGGINKSRMMLQWGFSVAAGAPIWGRKVNEAAFHFMSYEDNEGEIHRRANKIRERLNLPMMGERAKIKDLVATAEPLMVVTEEGPELQPLYFKIGERMARLPGQKLLVLNNITDGIQFRGSAKMSDGPVAQAISALAAICDQTATTIVGVFHPSRAGMGRGDYSSGSAQFENKSRAFITMTAHERIKKALALRVTKRNNLPPMEEPLLLRYSDGLIVPFTDLTDEGLKDAVVEACVMALKELIAMGGAVNKRDNVPPWVLASVEKLTGVTVSSKDFKDYLVEASGRKLVYFVEKQRGQVNGWRPIEERSDVPAEGDAYLDKDDR